MTYGPPLLDQWGTSAPHQNGGAAYDAGPTGSRASAETRLHGPPDERLDGDPEASWRAPARPKRAWPRANERRGLTSGQTHGANRAATA